MPEPDPDAWPDPDAEADAGVASAPDEPCVSVEVELPVAGGLDELPLGVVALPDELPPLPGGDALASGVEPVPLVPEALPEPVLDGLLLVPPLLELLLELLVAWLVTALGAVVVLDAAAVRLVAAWAGLIRSTAGSAGPAIAALAAAT